MTSTTEQPETAPRTTAEAKRAKKANVGKRARNVAPARARAGKKAARLRICHWRF